MIVFTYVKPGMVKMFLPPNFWTMHSALLVQAPLSHHDDHPWDTRGDYQQHVSFASIWSTWSPPCITSRYIFHFSLWTWVSTLPKKSVYPDQWEMHPWACQKTWFWQQGRVYPFPKEKALFLDKKSSSMNAFTWYHWWCFYLGSHTTSVDFCTTGGPF